MPVLIWPLMDKLRRPTAYQRWPKAMANARVQLPPTIPWDDNDRPGPLFFGQVRSDPQLWNIAPWNFGLCAIGVQSAFLTTFRTNPRANPVSEQTHEPAAIHPLIFGQVFPPSPPVRDDRQASPIIWPLLKRLAFNPKRIVAGSPINLQARLCRIAGQQNPNAVTGKPPAVLRPWAYGSPVFKPAVVHGLKPLPPRIATIEGFTRDNTGAILGNCIVELYLTATDEPLFKTTSDANGFFRFTAARYSPATHYLVAYKAGSPDVAGTSVNTLQGV